MNDDEPITLDEYRDAWRAERQLITRIGGAVVYSLADRPLPPVSVNHPSGWQW